MFGLVVVLTKPYFKYIDLIVLKYLFGPIETTNCIADQGGDGTFLLHLNELIKKQNDINT